MDRVETYQPDYAEMRQRALRRKQQLIERRDQIKLEKDHLDKEWQEIFRELTGLDKILGGLDFVEGEANPDSPGFTEHIRRILQQTTPPLTPVQIRDALVAAGVTGSSPKNLLISIHTVLTRLKPDLEEMMMDGKTAYRWKRTAQVPRGGRFKPDIPTPSSTENK